MENLTVISPIENITRIEYQGQPVLTTTQLAQFYETTVDALKMNFNRNRDQYVEGKHFFKLTGDELRVFKRKVTNCYLAENVNALYLWTKRGAFRHCKSVNTNRAWEVFELLEDNYFDRPANKQLADVLADFVALEREKFAVANSAETKAFAKAQLLRELASASGDNQSMRNKFLQNAAILLNDEDFDAKQSDSVLKQKEV